MLDQDLLRALESFSKSIRLPGISDRLHRIMFDTPIAYINPAYQFQMSEKFDAETFQFSRYMSQLRNQKKWNWHKSQTRGLKIRRIDYFGLVYIVGKSAWQ